MESAVRNAINAIVTELDLSEVHFSVEHPADLNHGDYATNVALVCAKQLGQPPREVAEAFLQALTVKI